MTTTIDSRRLNFQQVAIAGLSLLGIATHLALRFGTNLGEAPANIPLFITLLFGGVPLVWNLITKLYRRDFGADLLAGISIITAVILDEYLAGSLVVLMLSGGEALEGYAVRSASSVLESLANRMPSITHRKSDSKLEDIPIDDVEVGDMLVVFPHEICPVDGTVVEGHGVMDESYLTGEPYMMSKTPGVAVLSGAINGESSLIIVAEKLAVDSRYAKIMRVMLASQQQRPRLRRLGDKLGAFYTPLAIGLGALAWLYSGEPERFLSVLVVATPCPLLIAIPVAIIGAISLAAKRAIIVRDPVALEVMDSCNVIIFDKTGTLTYGEPNLTDQICSPRFSSPEVLSLVASAERYSKHPLASAIIRAAKDRKVVVHDASEIIERPGEGMRARVAGKVVRVTSRKQFTATEGEQAKNVLPPEIGGLECVILIDDHYAATYRFRDTPRQEGASFVGHLAPKHDVNRIILLSGDRESEVQYLASLVGIHEIHASQSPEEKLEFVRKETAQTSTVFVGDGINDAPALMAATVGIAFGQNSDVTSEAADVVVMDSSLQKMDEFIHISRRMKRIALQSAVGGMALSGIGMLIATAGYLPPVAGAVVQEVIDVLAVLNALRAGLPPKSLSDF